MTTATPAVHTEDPIERSADCPDHVRATREFALVDPVRHGQQWADDLLAMLANGDDRHYAEAVESLYLIVDELPRTCAVAATFGLARRLAERGADVVTRDVRAQLQSLVDAALTRTDVDATAADAWKRAIRKHADACEDASYPPQTRDELKTLLADAETPPAAQAGALFEVANRLHARGATSLLDELRIMLHFSAIVAEELTMDMAITYVEESLGDSLELWAQRLAVLNYEAQCGDLPALPDDADYYVLCAAEPSGYTIASRSYAELTHTTTAMVFANHPFCTVLPSVDWPEAFGMAYDQALDDLYSGTSTGHEIQAEADRWRKTPDAVAIFSV